MTPDMDSPPSCQTLATLDLEGVLVPEIWVAVAERIGAEDLKLTTRDIPDYDQLMRGRLAILEREDLGLQAVQEVIAGLGPLEGARDFLDRLRSRMQVIILSDTFEEFARPLMRQLGWPAIFCHRLEIRGDRIAGYRLRQSDQKRRAVAAFRSLGYRVLAAGDSFNDLSMLEEAHRGFLFRPPPEIAADHPQFPEIRDYPSLLEALEQA